MWAEHPLCNFSVSFFVFIPVWCLGACGLLLAQRPHEGEQGEGIVMGTALPLCSLDGCAVGADTWQGEGNANRAFALGPFCSFQPLLQGAGGRWRWHFEGELRLFVLDALLCCLCAFFFFFKNFSICPAALSLLSKLAYCGGSTCALPWPALGGQTGFSHLMSRLPPSLPKRFCTSLKA